MGGGIYNAPSASLTLSGTLISSNVALGGRGGLGGGGGSAGGGDGAAANGSQARIGGKATAAVGAREVPVEGARVVGYSMGVRRLARIDNHL